jgi:hypothetical protein
MGYRTNNFFRPTGRLLLVVAASLVLAIFVFAACGSQLEPLPERADIPQPTFVARDVTPPPESPTATPWPFPGEGEGLRAIPEGLDPELFSPADPEEVVNLWVDFLTGSAMHTTSDLRHFRGAQRFDGQLHMCPTGTGYLDGNPSGDAEWRVSPSVGSWFEVSLSHEIPGRLESVTFVLGIESGRPVRSGSPEVLAFAESDYCSNADPTTERPSFTVEERRLDERRELVGIDLDEIPWSGGEREFPAALNGEMGGGTTHDAAVSYWGAYLTGGVLDAVAYDYGTFVLTEAFSGSLHMCGGRVAVLDGTPSGIGEWAVQSSGTNARDAKILFTLPGDRTFRTLVLGVTPEGPVLMGRNEETGLISASPLELRESSECGGR